MKNILEYLEHSVGWRPEKTACADTDTSMTWRQLREASARIGSLLLKHRLTHRPVAVYMEKTPACLAAMLGTVYGGDFYTVIDTKMPWDRIRKIFSVLKPAAIITDRDHEETVREALASERKDSPKILLYEKAMYVPEDREGLAKIRRKAVDTDLVYTLFTSGSTGMPKGVAVSHRNVMAYAEWVKTTFDINEATVFGSQTPFYFSMSVLDIYTTLAAGAELQILPKQLFAFPVRLLEYMNSRKVNTIYWVPTALSIVANWKVLDYVSLPYMEKVLFAGEVMPVKQLNYWREYLPDVLYVNLYGPTEITCNCNYYIVDREFTEDQTLPIGVPFPNERVFLLDEEDHLVTEPGALGEICVSGTALALGYYRNSEKTSEAFVQNPLNHRYLEPIYRTGDLGRYENGELYYVTRKDFQIKHMGHRIELGEIETAFQALDGISRVCCIYDEPNTKIIGFYVGELEAKEIIERLTERLPRFMIPNVFRQVDEMPLTKNGKIDRKCLMEEYRESMQNRVKS